MPQCPLMSWFSILIFLQHIAIWYINIDIWLRHYFNSCKQKLINIIMNVDILHFISCCLKTWSGGIWIGQKNDQNPETIGKSNMWHSIQNYENLFHYIFFTKIYFRLQAPMGKFWWQNRKRVSQLMKNPGIMTGAKHSILIPLILWYYYW